MARGNYYLILGLSLDPPEERIEEIKRVIEQKRHEWSRGTMDFKKGPIFREYMALLPDIEKVMSTPCLRKKEAEEALTIIEAKILEQLAIVSRRGYLYEEEIKYIATKCQVTTEMVELKCQVPVRRQPEETQGLIRPREYDHFLVFSVYLEALQKLDYYDYLRKDRPYERVCRLSARDLLRLVHQIENDSGKYTYTDSANEKLCAECKRTFASEEGKKVYDEYLEWKKIQAVFEQIEVATRYTKVLEKEQREEAIKRLRQICGKEQRARELLEFYMKKEHIVSAEDTKKPIQERAKKPMQGDTKKPMQGGTRKPMQEGIKKPLQMENNKTRASTLYPRVVRIREEMSQCHYEEATRLLEEAITQCGSVPELMRIEDQLSGKKKALYAMLNHINEDMDKKRFYSANQELIQLKKEFPTYQNRLIEAKITHGLICGKNYLTQAKMAKDEESLICDCMDALEVCADYPGVMELLEKHPPRLSGTIGVSIDSIHHCNYIQWNDNKKEPFISYSILRKKEARPFHRQDGTVLGTVSGNSFVDHSIVSGEIYYYAVYAVRCGVYSNGLVTPTGYCNYCEVENPSTKTGIDSIELTWSRVPRGAVIEVYRKNNYVPDYPKDGIRVFNVTEKGCKDMDVTPGNLYGYRIFAVYNKNGEKHYSSGVPFKITFGVPGFQPATKAFVEKEKIRITYYFEVKKQLLSSNKILLHVKPEQYIRTMPPLLVVGSMGEAPLHKSSGKVITILPAQELKEELVYTIKYKEIENINFINIFLQREEDNKEYQLTLKRGESLQIRA